MARVILVRHGRPSHVERGWIDRAGLDRWQAAYDACGLAEGDAPPPALRALARDAHVLACSDMPRALASAALLRDAESVAEPLVSPLLREIPLRMPAWRRVRLPLSGWALAIGLGAAYRALRAVPPPPAVSAQARDAAAWLATLARERGTVLAVTHAALRNHVVAALRRDGWTGPASRSYRHWSAWELRP